MQIQEEEYVGGIAGQPQLQQPQGGGYYQPVIMPSDKADLYDKIRPEDVIEVIKYKLMGYNFDDRKQQWVMNYALKEISLSEIGAEQIATLLFGVSNKSVSISKLEDRDIRGRTKFLVDTTMRNCLTKWKQYGIKDASTFPFIKEVVISIAFITLKQPEKAGVRQFIQGVTQENRTIVEQPRKEGVFSSIFRR